MNPDQTNPNQFNSQNQPNIVNSASVGYPQDQYLPYQSRAKRSKQKRLLISAVLGLVVAIGIIGAVVIASNDSRNNASSKTGTSNQKATFQEEKNQQIANIDTQHKNNVANIVASVAEYMANNQGKRPVNAAAVKTLAASRDITNPTTGELYSFSDTQAGKGQIWFRPGVTCSPTDASLSPARDFSLVLLLESGEPYCQDV